VPPPELLVLPPPELLVLPPPELLVLPPLEPPLEPPLPLLALASVPLPPPLLLLEQPAATATPRARKQIPVSRFFDMTSLV